MDMNDTTTGVHDDVTTEVPGIAVWFRQNGKIVYPVVAAFLCIVTVIIIVVVVVYHRSRKRHRTPTHKPILPKLSDIDDHSDCTTQYLNNPSGDSVELQKQWNSNFPSSSSSSTPTGVRAPGQTKQQPKRRNNESTSSDGGEDDSDTDHDYQNTPDEIQKYKDEMQHMKKISRKPPPTPKKERPTPPEVVKNASESDNGCFRLNNGLSSSSGGPYDNDRTAGASAYHTKASKGYINEKLSNSLEVLTSRVVPQPPRLSDSPFPSQRKMDAAPSPAPKPHNKGKPGYVNQPA